MKNYSVRDLVILILTCTVCFVLCSTIIGMVFSRIPTTEFNAPIREKLIDLLEMISGGVIMAIGIQSTKDKNPPL